MESLVGLFISSQWEVERQDLRTWAWWWWVLREKEGVCVCMCVCASGLNRWTTRPCVFREIIWDNLAKTDWHFADKTNHPASHPLFLPSPTRVCVPPYTNTWQGGFFCLFFCLRRSLGRHFCLKVRGHDTNRIGQKESGIRQILCKQ